MVLLKLEFDEGRAMEEMPPKNDYLEILLIYKKSNKVIGRKALNTKKN
jgi:hypothetical protein